MIASVVAHLWFVFCVLDVVFVMYSMTMGPVLLIWRRVLLYRSRPTAETARTARNSTAPSVSIIRPLKGVDDNLYGNLESSFLMRYPIDNFEILLCVARDDDPCVAVCQDLMKKYPRVRCRLMVGESNVGPNPKVCNLMKAYNHSTADILWILDSNVSLAPSALATAVAILSDRNVGLVHHVPVGQHVSTLGGFLDSVYISSTHSRVYSAVNFLGVASMIIGKSNLYRKSDMELCGGMPQFAQYMSEDNKIGEALMMLGRTHQISPELAYQSIGTPSFHEFMQRRIRWIRIRKYVVPVATLYEPFTECLVHSALTSYMFHGYLGLGWGFMMASIIVLWFFSDLVMLVLTYWNWDWRTTIGDTDGGLRGHWRDLVGMLFVWWFRELLAFPIWILAMLGTEVMWRGVRYHCNTDGTGLPVKIE